MIKQADSEYKPLELEKSIQDFWVRTKAYAKTVASREKDPDFYFVDGPPYTSGAIHLGQVLNKTVKDAVVRWRRMHGHHVRDQAGYDMHGLPIEVQVEKSLGITNKKEIEELGIEKFVNACRDFALDLLKKMNVAFQDLGVWLDWDHPYMTITNDYIEGAWWTFKRAFENGLLYEALRSLQWCSRCETALADAEVEYADETDPSVYVKFPVADRPGEFLLIWTTTPWTLPANMGIAVHPEFTYAKVRVSREGPSEHLWILESAVPSVMALGGVKDCEVVSRVKGSDLLGTAYTNPLGPKVPYQAKVHGQWVHKVLPSEIVEAEHTGLVHTAPGHGPEDFELGQRHGIPVFSPVDERGHYTADAGDYAGLHVREANPRIVQDLKDLHALFAEETITHSYGHCWRCKTPILFRATVQWFLKVTDVKARMLEEIARVQWYPEWAGAARQADWTRNLRDWCLSRQRYWGIPLPIWRCTKCAAWTVVGSADELHKAKGFTPGMDLHRPWIDAVVVTCEKCGGDMNRIKDVLDVWFDSGVASWASLGYPAREDEFKRWWPAKWIVEGPDQTRGWFNSQLAAGVIAFDRAPYDSVLMHGWVNGPDGRQMHKSLGNVIEPSTVIAKFGVDALRFYVVAVNAIWEDITFQEEGVRTCQRTLNILWNVLRFATTYMTLDRFDPERSNLTSHKDHLRLEDRWLLSRLEGLKATFDKEMESYSMHRAYRAVDGFILDDLSRWYVKLARERTWIDADDQGKTAAYAVLHETLVTLAALLAPLTPHIAEAVYQHLDGRRLSVHMLDWPAPHPERVDAGLEKSMAIAQELVEAVSKERQKGGRKLRWPVRLIAVKGLTPDASAALATLKPVFLDQANAKELTVLRPDEEFPGLSLLVKPDPAAIGKAYRALWPKIASVLATRPAEEVKRALDKGSFSMGIEGQTVTIEPHMVKFERQLPEDVAVVQTVHGELFIDMRVTPEIRAEGYAREVIRRIQQMRKDINLEVDDYVVTTLRASPALASALESQQELVARETRSRILSFADKDVRAEYVVEWNDVEGQSVTVGLTPLHMSEALREFTRLPGMTPAKALLLFDAGYKSVAALRAASRGELAAIEGLEAGDAARIVDALTQQPTTMVACSVCGAPVSKEARRCPRCGEPLATRIVPCPRCSAPVPPGEDACPVCGLSLAVPGPSAAGSSQAACPACGEQIPVHAEVCPSCGARQSSAPKPEPRPVAPGQAHLRGSSTYLVEEDQPDAAYRLFREAVAAGTRGLCVTRVYPQKLRERFGDAEVRLVWLSNVGKEEAIRPKDLEKLSLSVEQFVAQEHGVVLLDGVEYLVTNNNFLTVLRLVQAMRDQVAINNGILLLSVSPSTLESHQLTLLEREVDQVIGSSSAPAA
jgi:isoleucyl-tRNA synthetase